LPVKAKMSTVRKNDEVIMYNFVPISARGPATESVLPYSSVVKWLGEPRGGIVARVNALVMVGFWCGSVI
jgi:hypothetical protein